MTKQRAKLTETSVTFSAPTALVEKLDRLATEAMTSRGAVLRQLAARAPERSA